MEKRIVPVLKVVSGNKYLRALMEGFYVTLPIIVFSSIIGIIMWVPPAIKGDMNWYPLEIRQFLNRLYVLTMGLISIWFSMGIAIALGEKLNNNLPKNRKMNITMVSFAAGSAVFLMSVSGTFSLSDNGEASENFANVLISNLGSQGMLTSIIIGLTLPWIFYVPVRFGWTIKLPKAVPQGVSQSFADIIPYGLSVMVYWGFGYIFIYTMDVTFTDALFKLIQPLFNGLDSYGFLAAIAFLTAFVWFIGVHGPSVTRPFLTPFMYSNLASNQQLFAQGQHAHWALTYEFSYDFTSTLGGTGATFVIPILFIMFCKSKKLKAVGIASYIPIWFQVNEPALFGAPLILNPIFMIPFLVLPVINILIYKFFIELGMNGAIADVPWSLPAIVGLLIGSGFDPLTALLWVVLVTVDFIFYIPFVLMHDKMTCQEEINEANERGLAMPVHYSFFNYLVIRMQSKSKNPIKQQRYIAIKEEIAESRRIKKEEKAEEKAALIAEKKAKKEQKLNKKNKVLESIIENKVIDSGVKDKIHILVICYGAGTSAMMANSLTKAARKEGINNFVIDSAANGAHIEKIKGADLVILSPQVKMYADDFKASSKEGSVVVSTNGKQYIDATKDPELAMKLVREYIPEESIKYNK